MKTTAMCMTTALTFLAAALVPQASEAASTSPGKSSAYESFSGPLPTTGSPGVLVTATIVKGKKKRVVEALATISIPGPSTSVGLNLSARLEVNGVAMETPGSAPDPGGHHVQTCYDDGVNPVLGCTLTIAGWLDLDAAELANPGVFVNQQLDVTLSGGGFDAFSGVVSGEVILSVRMEKK